LPAPVRRHAGLLFEPPGHGRAIRPSVAREPEAAVAVDSGVMPGRAVFPARFAGNG